jgi:hypothetical protein
MTQKALLQSAGDGTTVPAGYVGERINSVGLISPGAISNTTVSNVSIAGSLSLSAGIYLVFFGAGLRSQGRHSSTTDYQQGGSITMVLFDGSTNIDAIVATSLVPAQPSTGPGGGSIYKSLIVTVGSSGKTFSLRYSTTVDGAVTFLYREISTCELYAVRIA